MIPALPEEFISRMMNDLGGEYPAFERELEGNPHRGIRFHPSRSIRHIPETEVLDPIPWEKNGSRCLKTGTYPSEREFWSCELFLFSEICYHFRVKAGRSLRPTWNELFQEVLHYG